MSFIFGFHVSSSISVMRLPTGLSFGLSSGSTAWWLGPTRISPCVLAKRLWGKKKANSKWMVKALNQRTNLSFLYIYARLNNVWNRLPRVKKLLGRWLKIGLLFICLPTTALFSSNLPVSCQFREFLSIFNVQEHSFHQFLGLRHPAEQSISMILIILWLKSTQIWEMGHIITWQKMGYIKVAGCRQNANLLQFGVLKLW